jgi:hypothetical protein
MNNQDYNQGHSNVVLPQETKIYMLKPQILIYYYCKDNAIVIELILTIDQENFAHNMHAMPSNEYLLEVAIAIDMQLFAKVGLVWQM